MKHRKLLLALATSLILGACAGPTDYVERACDKSEQNSARLAAREASANEGLYMKCVEPGRSWSDYVLTLDGQPVP